MKRALSFLLSTIVLVLSVGSSLAQNNGLPFTPDPNRPVGVTVNTDQVSDGYILVSVLQSKRPWLMTNDGRVIKYWDSDYYPANSVYLTDEGHLIRPTSLPDPLFGPSGPWTYMNGRIEELSWDSELLTEFTYFDERFYGHHDIEILPNGNVLVLAYDRFYADEAIAQGRSPDLIPEDGELWAEKIVEIEPSTGAVVWEWRVWDHLIQEFDPSLPNYGELAQNPGKIDINFVDKDLSSDWLHANTVSYNAERDEIIVSPKDFNEVWVIDHSINTEEAQGEAGDLIYRWGNPEAHGVGAPEDQQLIGQHDPHWIPKGLPGEDHILIFDNGNVDRPYSRIVEIVPPLDENGDYIMNPGEPTGPAEPVWTYVADPPESFYSNIISAAQRMPNGNTFITEGAPGRLFEVSPDGEMVWELYLPPAARAFRAERYNLDIFADLDQGQDLREELGFNEIWSVECPDGTAQELHRYLTNEAESMQLFIDTHGEAAQEQWGTEACAEHMEESSDS